MLNSHSIFFSVNDTGYRITFCQSTLNLHLCWGTTMAVCVSAVSLLVTPVLPSNTSRHLLNGVPLGSKVKFKISVTFLRNNSYFLIMLLFICINSNVICFFLCIITTQINTLYLTKVLGHISQSLNSDILFRPIATGV